MVTLWILLLLLTGSTLADVFSSTSELMDLAYTERNILMPALDNYLRKEEMRISILRRHYELIEAGIAEDEDLLDYVAHPINSLHLVKRFSHSWPEVDNHIIANLDAFTSYNSEVETAIPVTGALLPGDGEYKAACRSLIGLQRVYGLDTSRVMAGYIRGNGSRQPLDAEDCVNMARYALLDNRFSTVNEWASAALDKDDINEEFALEALTSAAEAAHLEGNVTGARYYIDLLLQKELDNNIALALLEEVNSGPAENYTLEEDTVTTNYAALCRGEQLLTAVEQSRLFCRYRPTTLPIETVKEEVLSTDPWISVMYDVISTEEAEVIKQFGKAVMMRAKVSGKHPNQTDDSVSFARVGNVGWVSAMDHDVAQRLSRRVSRMTQLDTSEDMVTSSSEAFQIVNYGIGGMYEPHFDYFDREYNEAEIEPFLNSRNRIATFLFYLTDVNAGGATVFPNARVAVPLVKYGAAFWYNLKRSGVQDKKTQHAGCPVLLGNKWVVNKWVREYGQEFRRTCGSTPNAVDEYHR